MTKKDELSFLVAKFKAGKISNEGIKRIFAIITEKPIKKFIITKELDAQDIRQEYHMGIIRAIERSNYDDVSLLSYIRIYALGSVKIYSRKVSKEDYIHVCPECGKYGKVYQKKCSRCGAVFCADNLARRKEDLVEDSVSCGDVYDKSVDQEQRLDTIYSAVYESISDNLAKRVLVLLRDQAVYGTKNYLKTLATILHVSKQTIVAKIKKIQTLAMELSNKAVSEFGVI